MSRIKKVLQHDETDCGAACISIIFLLGNFCSTLRCVVPQNQAFRDSAIRSLLRNTSCPYNPCCIVVEK